MDDQAAQRCYRHPDREAHIRCQRCERLICPECMRDASVGYQCPECVRAGAASMRAPRTSAGGRLATRPGIVTFTIIGINVALFVLTDLLRISAIDAAGIMVGRDVLDDGRLYPGVAGGGYWRLLTSAFLHDGIAHLLFNMLALYLFGTFVEAKLGTARYIAAYLTMAVGSSVFVYWLSDPGQPTVGASGAIFGLLGMALMLLLRDGEDVRGLLALLAINAVLSLRANISWEGHLGGFVVGCLLGAVFAWVPRRLRGPAQTALWIVAWIAIVAGTAVRTAVITG